MVRRYIWMLCVTTLCLLSLGWFGTPATAVPVVSATASVFRQDDDVADDTDQTEGEEDAPEATDGQADGDPESDEQAKSAEDGQRQGQERKVEQGQGPNVQTGSRQLIFLETRIDCADLFAVG